jgi:hypothetical protein
MSGSVVATVISYQSSIKRILETLPKDIEIGRGEIVVVTS